MAGNVVVEQASVSVVPGETATTSVRVRNTGAVVDSYSLTVLGQAAAWTTVVPAALSLFPGADGTMSLHFAPPRTADVGSGAVPFGVRVVGSEDPDNPMVEEGEVELLPFVEVAAKLTPRTSEAKRKSRHEIVLDNKGNAPVGVALSVSDPDEQLAFQLAESHVTVGAGQSRHVAVRVMAKKGFARGGDKHRPFQAVVRPDGQSFPITLDGNLVQKAGLPRFVLPLVAGVVAVALIAAVLPSLLKKDGGKGNLQLTAEQAATSTTVAAAGGGDEEDPNAPATAEEQAAAAAAELAANGKDGDGGATGGSGGGDSGSGGGTGGGTATATGSAAGTSGAGVGSTSDGSTNTTAVKAGTGTAPGGSTTTAPTGSSGSSTTTSTSAPAAAGSTTTTTSTPTSTASKFVGLWGGTDHKVSICNIDKVTLGISVSGASSGSGTVGRDTAESGAFTITTSDGVSRTFRLSGDTTMTMTYRPQFSKLSTTESMNKSRLSSC